MSLVTALSLAVSCTSKTPYGECVGINEKQDPNLVYKIPTENIVVTVIFCETIFVPIVTLLNQTYCPVGRIEETKK